MKKDDSIKNRIGRRYMPIYDGKTHEDTLRILQEERNKFNNMAYDCYDMVAHLKDVFMQYPYWEGVELNNHVNSVLEKHKKQMDYLTKLQEGDCDA